jgi:hypothetical protein
VNRISVAVSHRYVREDAAFVGMKCVDGLLRGGGTGRGLRGGGNPKGREQTKITTTAENLGKDIGSLVMRQ